MTEKILVPLDGSKLGESALRYLERLVDKLEPGKKPQYTLLHVLATPVHHIPVEGGTVDVFDTASDLDSAKKQALAYLERSAKKLRDSGAKVDCVTVVSADGVSSAETILKFEEETKPDLVAMSTHGRRGLTRWAFGSVTEKVLRGGTVPVLMVRI